MAVEYIALYTHQALEQKSLTLDLAILLYCTASLQRAMYCSHTQKTLILIKPISKMSLLRNHENFITNLIKIEVNN